MDPPPTQTNATQTIPFNELHDEGLEFGTTGQALRDVSKFLSTDSGELGRRAEGDRFPGHMARRARGCR